MLRIATTNDATQTITIHAQDGDWIRRVVSKLLIGGSRWSVSWSETEIHVTTTKSQFKCLAKNLTSPTFTMMLNKVGSPHFTSHPAWSEWADDRRFKDYLLTDERFDAIKEELYQAIQHEQVDMESWLATSPQVTAFLNDMNKELEDGSIADKLVAGGYM